MAKEISNKEKCTEKFVVTADDSVAQTLISHGYKLLPFNNYGRRQYVFINAPTLDFDDSVDISKVHFTNNICI